MYVKDKRRDIQQEFKSTFQKAVHEIMASLSELSFRWQDVIN